MDAELLAQGETEPAPRCPVALRRPRVRWLHKPRPLGSVGEEEAAAAVAVAAAAAAAADMMMVVVVSLGGRVRTQR